VAELRGVLTALVTPFTAGGESVDEPRLRDLVDRMIASGVHGLVPCGSTGEFPALTHDERKLVVEVVVDQTAGRVPVVAHTAAMTTREAVALSRHAEKHGAAAVMVVAPYYEPLTLGELASYYRDVAQSVSIDVMLYNLPIATGVNLAPPDVVKLASELPNVRHVKDTSGDYNQATVLIHEYEGVLSTFVGADSFFLASLVEGAVGSVIGAANVIPSELVAIYDAVQASDVIAAKAIWSDVYPFMQFLMSGGYVSGVKGSMKLIDQAAGDPRLPIEPLPENRIAEAAAALKKIPSLSAAAIPS
jgi:4-hydroxy-tetrahydrodipicolinate synthase